MKAAKGTLVSQFLAFLQSFFRFFSKRGPAGPKVQKFTYDYPAGPRPRRIDRGHQTTRGACHIVGNRWWRRQLSLRGREVIDDEA
jgi:hypothetical protein